MTTREDGAPSRTVFRVLARGEEATLVRCRIYTGRQHQIRLHARALGHPVWRDPLYGDGDPADLPGIDRQALHAWRLRVEHPSGSGPVEWIAPVPDDLRALIAEAVGPAGVRALGALDHGE